MDLKLPIVVAALLAAESSGAERFESLAANFSQAAAEPMAGGAGAEEQWWVTPSFAIWLAGLSGDVGVRDVTMHLDLSFSDIYQDTDSIIGLAGSVRFGRGKLGGFVNGMWMKLGQDTPTPLGSAHTVIEQSLMDFGVSYEVGRWPMEWTRTADKPARDLTVNAYVGGRYNSVDIDVQFPVIPSRGHNKDWVDPIIGALVDFPFAQDWSIVARGDIGGFGAASEFAWSASLLGSWDFRIGKFPSSLQFGYIAVGDDYDTGSGNDRFLWDVVMHGPVLNWLIRF